jgi:hypothetical protein
MKTQDLINDLTYEYNSFKKLASMYFDKWIETGEDIYKENELLHIGAAHAMLRIKDILTVNQIGE